MSSDKMCCVPGCKDRGDNLHYALHIFPNPKKDSDRFRKWLYAIGSDILALEDERIYKYRRVCHLHFEDKYKCRYNKISKTAVPTLNIPGPLSPVRLVTRSTELRPMKTASTEQLQPVCEGTSSVSHPYNAHSSFVLDDTHTRTTIEIKMLKRSAQSRITYYENKIRKIKEQERQGFPLDSSSEDEGNEYVELVMDNNPDIAQELIMTLAPETSQDPLLDPIEHLDENNVLLGPSYQDDTTAADELDPDPLSALGESMSDAPEYGDNINENQAKLWLPLLKRGMAKESKDKIFNEYLVPNNCRLLQAPKLNAEISAEVPDMVRNRDKTLGTNQQQLGLGITAINRGIDILLKSKDKAQALRHISSGCRLLCDLHYLQSENRIKLLTPSLDKSILHIIGESERDETLFGSCLSEKIKAAKDIEKQERQLKKPAPSPSQGNWSAPPRYQSANREGRAGYRKLQTTPGTRRFLLTTSHSHRTATHDKPRVSYQDQQ